MSKPDPTPAVTMREPPSWHGPAAQKAFRELRHLVEDDRDWTAFETLAAAVGEYRDAVEQLQADGRTAAGERGGIKAHPLLSYVKAQHDACLKGLSEFGLTPRSRGVLKPEEVEGPVEEPDHGPDGDPATLVERIKAGRKP